LFAEDPSQQPRTIRSRTLEAQQPVMSADCQDPLPGPRSQTGSKEVQDCWYVDTRDVRRYLLSCNFQYFMYLLGTGMLVCRFMTLRKPQI
jgi:hypothetical protein